MRRLYPEYNVNYISGCMNLRPPQKRSLKILDDILDELDLEKGQDLDRAREIVHDIFPNLVQRHRLISIAHHEGLFRLLSLEYLVQIPDGILTKALAYQQDLQFSLFCQVRQCFYRLCGGFHRLFCVRTAGDAGEDADAGQQ